MTKTVALLGALGTKGAEYGFVKQCVEARGHKTLLIDVGVLQPPVIEPDISRREVAEAWINVPDTMPRNRNWPFDPEGLVLFDASGRAMSTQWEGRTPETYCVAELHTRAFPYNCQRHRVFFDTGTVPACGYKVFRVGSIDEAGGDEDREGAAWDEIYRRTGTYKRTYEELLNDLINNKEQIERLKK